MTEDIDTRRVSPLLPILGTVGWLILMVLVVLPAMFSAMLFDSGGSVPAAAVFYGLWATLPLCLFSIIAGWVVWGVTRGTRTGGSRIARGVVYLLPLVGLGVAALGLLWIQTACSGSLAC